MLLHAIIFNPKKFGWNILLHNRICFQYWRLNLYNVKLDFSGLGKELLTIQDKNGKTYFNLSFPQILL